MQVLADKWAGRIYGTNTGNLFIELRQDGDKLSGIARIMDDLYGLAMYDLSGTYGDKIVLHGLPRTSTPNQLVGEIAVEATLTSEGKLRGTWHSTIGTAGTFEAYPHDLRAPAQAQGAMGIVPEQIYNKNIALGSIRLFSDDVRRLIAFIEQDFQVRKSVVTYYVRGSQATKYSIDFLRELETLGEIRYLKVSIQEPEAYGINRIIVVELVEHGVSEVKVSGINEAWVIGKAESISQALKPYQSGLLSAYRKHGLNLNAIIFFGTLIVIPEIQTWQRRAIFVVVVFGLLNLLFWIHSRFIPNTVIYLTGRKPSVFSRVWPSILSWLGITFSAVVAGLVLWLLTGNHGS